MATGITRANPGWEGSTPYPTQTYASDGTVGTDSLFIPAVWSGKLVEKFYTATVFGAIANTDYEGEVSDFGDQVIIRTTPTITITNYTIGLGLTYEVPSSASTSLDLNKGKYFAFAVDDVDGFQADIDLMDDWSEDASEQLKIAVDSDVLTNIPAGVDAANTGNSAGAISGDIALGATGTNGSNAVLLDKTSIVDHIIDYGTVLDEQNVPETGRWMVLPAWAIGRIKKSDLKDASLAGDSVSIARNGLVGMVDRFYIYLSNNIAGITEGTATLYRPIAGHMAGLTFAAQMVKMETLPNPDTFGQLVRGLNVYGYKVLEGKYLASGYVKKV
jgi:hypothetical protein